MTTAPSLVSQAWPSFLPVPPQQGPYEVSKSVSPSPAHPSAPGLGPPLPHLYRDWAQPCHICTGNGPTPAPSAPGLGPALPDAAFHHDVSASDASTTACQPARVRIGVASSTRRIPRLPRRATSLRVMTESDPTCHPIAMWVTAPQTIFVLPRHRPRPLVGGGRPGRATGTAIGARRRFAPSVAAAR